MIDVVLDSRVRGWTRQQISQEYPHLTLAQIHAALTYYYDHQAELDAKIEQDQKTAEELRRQAGESHVVARLRAEGKLP